MKLNFLKFITLLVFLTLLSCEKENEFEPLTPQSDEISDNIESKSSNASNAPRPVRLASNSNMIYIDEPNNAYSLTFSVNNVNVNYPSMGNNSPGLILPLKVTDIIIEVFMPDGSLHDINVFKINKNTSTIRKSGSSDSNYTLSVPLTGRNRQLIKHFQWMAKQVPGARANLIVYLKESHVNISTYNSILNNNRPLAGIRASFDVGREQRIEYRINN
ncbi:hypothetical protein ABW636_02100 [Aquimarina sp. 2201CG1-2-11]|uniref:hypothetical protein n=1 Tax=Aquimarina discodermiae TaxID=3231043 RepID=UPI003462C561